MDFLKNIFTKLLNVPKFTIDKGFSLSKWTLNTVLTIILWVLAFVTSLVEKVRDKVA